MIPKITAYCRAQNAVAYRQFISNNFKYLAGFNSFPWMPSGSGGTPSVDPTQGILDESGNQIIDEDGRVILDS